MSNMIDIIQANPTVLTKVLGKVNKQVYYDACLEAEVCPICGKELNVYEDHAPPYDKAYNCGGCEFEHGSV